MYTALVLDMELEIPPSVQATQRHFKVNVQDDH